MNKLRQLLIELLIIALFVCAVAAAYRLYVHISTACPNTGWIFISCGPFSLY